VLLLAGGAFGLAGCASAAPHVIGPGIAAPTTQPPPPSSTTTSTTTSSLPPPTVTAPPATVPTTVPPAPPFPVTPSLLNQIDAELDQLAAGLAVTGYDLSRPNPDQEAP
jgi:hypothetical protein